MSSIRVVLVCEQPAILFGLTRLLQDAPDLEVAAAAASATAAIEVVPTARPDLILIDLAIQPAGTGLALTRRFSHPPIAAPVLLVGDAADPATREAAARAGAAGLLARSAGLDAILAAVRRAARDAPGFFLCDGDSPVHGAAEPVRAEGLNASRTRLLRQVSAGLSNRRIAMLEGVSERTVKRRISALYERLGASHRAGAVAVAMQRGLI